MRNLLLVAAILFAGISAAQADRHDRRIVVINKTPYRMTGLYASNTGANKWRYNMLKSDYLAPNDSIVANVDDGSGYCMFDLLATFEDNTEAKSYNIDACKAETWTVHE